MGKKNIIAVALTIGTLFLPTSNSLAKCSPDGSETYTCAIPNKQSTLDIIAEKMLNSPYHGIEGSYCKYPKSPNKLENIPYHGIVGPYCEYPRNSAKRSR